MTATRDLTIVCPHVGGGAALPDRTPGPPDDGAEGGGAENLTSAPPSEYLRQDLVRHSLTLAGGGWRYGLEIVGAETQLMFASDHPWVEPDVISPIVDSFACDRRGSGAKIYGGERRAACLGWTRVATSEIPNVHRSLTPGCVVGWRPLTPNADALEHD